MKTKIIKGRGKIFFYDEKDREKMEKKYPNIEFNKMNALTFTTTYKGDKQFDVKIKVGNTEIPCSFNKWAWPWKYGSKVELRLHFKDLKKKTITHITGGVQGKLFQFFRYDYEKMINDDPKLDKKVSKKTKRIKKPKIVMVEYSKGKALRKVYNVEDRQKKIVPMRKTMGGSKKMYHKNQYISDSTLKSLQKLSYQDLKNLSPVELQKYKKRVGIIEQEHGPSFTDEELIGMLRKYIATDKINQKKKKRTQTKKKGGAKKTFKSEQKKENKEYHQSIKKCRKIKDKKQKTKCYIKCNNKRGKTLKLLEKKYPKEWTEFKNNYGGMGTGGFHESTRLEGSWM